MRIAVSGAGPAGMTAAYWLVEHGHDVVLIEEAPSLRRDGYGLDFFGTGFDVAERMGLRDTLFERELNAEYIGFMTPEGDKFGHLTVEAIRKHLDGRYTPLMHYTLEDVLFEALPDTVEVRFGIRIEAVAQTDDDVTCTFSDGSEDTFDLLVGAEGFKSHLRDLVFGPIDDFKRYLGLHVAAFLFEDDLDLGNGWLNVPGVGWSVGAYPTDRDGIAASLFIWEREDDAYVPPEDRMSMLRKAFADSGEFGNALLDRAPDQTPAFFDTATQIRMPSWSKGRVALVGDAAYCLTLLSGQGSSMAMGGAYILAEELSFTDDHREAFVNYENRLRPHIEMRQDKAKDLVKSFVPSSESMLKVEKVAFKVILRDAFSGVVTKYMYMGDSLIRERMLHRLPRSHANVLGYRLSGKVDPIDLQMLDLDVAHALEGADDVRILCHLDDFEHLTFKGIVADFSFGRTYGDRISKLAIVGDTFHASALATAARPFGDWEVHKFDVNELDDAWAWAAG